MARRRRAEHGARALVALVAGALLAAAAPVRATPVPPATEGGGAPAAGGALRVSAEPARLVLGRDPGADLFIHVPPGIDELSVTANAGRIEGVRRLPTGGFAARFRPPAERFPQVAIVAVTATGPAGPLDGWLAIPLSGQGDARVRARPGQVITLRVGERTFGPKVAGGDGLAVIPVVVPPGVREAHHGFRPVDLHVPETPLVHAVAHRGTVHADRAEQVRVVVYVVAPHGAARRGDVPVLEPSRGSVAVSPREAGAFEVVWTLPPGAAGEERLAVRLAGAPASKALVRVGAVPGAPAAVAVSFDREAAVADGDARPQVLVTARVVDAAGNTTPGGPVELAADGGTLSATVERAPGVYEAHLEVPRRHGGRRELRVTAREEKGLSGERALPLKPGPPATARVERRVLVADGATEASLRVVVLDRHENPVDVRPTVTAALGRVVGVAPDDEDGSRVRYLPPAVGRRSEERLAVEVGGVRAEGTLLLVPPRNRDGLVVAAGVAAGSHGALGPRAAIALERDAARAPRGIALSWRVEAEWTSLARRVDAGDDEPRRELTSRAGALLVGASARRELGAVTAWASASAGVVHEASSPGDGGAAPAGRLALGVGWPQRRWIPLLEASVLAADRGAMPAFALSAGARFGLGESRGDDPDRR